MKFLSVSNEENSVGEPSLDDEFNFSQGVASSSSVSSKIKKPKSSSSNFRACRLLLSEITRLRYDIPEEEIIFVELTSQLSSMVAELQAIQLKENGPPLRKVPLKSNNKNYLDLPKAKKRKKTKNNNKVGYNHDLIAAHFTIQVLRSPKQLSM